MSRIHAVFGSLRDVNRHRACMLLVVPCVKELQYVAVTAVYEALKLLQADIAILVKNICLPQSSFNSVWNLYVNFKDFADVIGVYNHTAGAAWPAVYCHIQPQSTLSAAERLARLLATLPVMLHVIPSWISLLVLICHNPAAMQ